MKPPLRSLIKLYPVQWRDRYGEEMQALMEDATPRWGDVWNVLGQGLLERSLAMKAWQWILVGTTMSLLIILFATARVPATYTSTSVLSMTTPESKVGTPWPAMTVSRLKHMTLAFHQPIEMIKRLHLHEREMAEGRETDALIAFHKSLVIECVSHPGCEAVRIRYTGANPSATQKVTQELTANFIDTNVTRYPTRGTQDGPTLKLLDRPTLPSRNQYLNLQSPRLYGALLGLALGLSVTIATLFGSRRFTARHRQSG